MRFVTALACLAVLVAPALAQSGYDWVTEMRNVHSSFTGQAGTISRFGDSISVSQAYFMPLNSTPSNMDAASSAAIAWLHSYSPSSRPMWSWQNDNQGLGYAPADYARRGVNGGTQASWPLQTDQSGGVKTNIQKWLDEQNPEMAVIMWGTNDARNGVSQTTYINNMRTVIQTVKAKGTIPIVTTASPVYNYQTQSANFAQAIRDLCATEKVPLIDYYNEIVTRQPGTWNGTLMNLNDVHPSYTAGNNFSASSLNTSGYTLRNYLTLLKMNEVYQQVIVPEPASLSVLVLGGLALLRKRR